MNNDNRIIIDLTGDDLEEQDCYIPVQRRVTHLGFIHRMWALLDQEIYLRRDPQEIIYWELFRDHQIFCPPFQPFFFRIPSTRTEEIYFDNIIDFFYIQLGNSIEYVRIVRDGQEVDEIINDYVLPREPLEFTNRIN